MRYRLNLSDDATPPMLLRVWVTLSNMALSSSPTSTRLGWITRCRPEIHIQYPFFCPASPHSFHRFAPICCVLNCNYSILIPLLIIMVCLNVKSCWIHQYQQAQIRFKNGKKFQKLNYVLQHSDIFVTMVTNTMGL